MAVRIKVKIQIKIETLRMVTTITIKQICSVLLNRFYNRSSSTNNSENITRSSQSQSIAPLPSQFHTLSVEARLVSRDPGSSTNISSTIDAVEPLVLATNVELYMLENDQLPPSIPTDLLSSPSPTSFFSAQSSSGNLQKRKLIGEAAEEDEPDIY